MTKWRGVLRLLIIRDPHSREETPHVPSPALVWLDCWSGAEEVTSVSDSRVKMTASPLTLMRHCAWFLLVFSMKTHCFMIYDTTALPPRAATWARTMANTSHIKAWRKPLTPPSSRNDVVSRMKNMLMIPRYLVILAPGIKESGVILTTMTVGIPRAAAGRFLKGPSPNGLALSREVTVREGRVVGGGTDGRTADQTGRVSLSAG